MAAANITVSDPLPESIPQDFSLMNHLRAGTKLVIAKITFDGGNYATGGTAVDFTDYMTNVEHVLVAPISGYVCEWVPSTGKVKVFEAGADAAALDEYANGSAISLATWAWVIGY
jgi:hypothetical protein